MKPILTFLLSIIVFTCMGQTINERVRVIRYEYSMINANRHLIKDTIELPNETAEGALLVTYRDAKGNIRKFLAKYYGETFKYFEEYYLKNGTLFFCLTQAYSYNRPFYWNEEMVREAGAGEVFDEKKTVITENRYYFDDNSKLIRMIDKDKKVIQKYERLKKFEVGILKDFKKLMIKKRRADSSSP